MLVETTFSEGETSLSSTEPVEIHNLSVDEKLIDNFSASE